MQSYKTVIDLILANISKSSYKCTKRQLFKIRSSFLLNNYLQMYKTLQQFSSLFTEITNTYKQIYKYKSYLKLTKCQAY